MERAIKFRGKSKLTGNWFYGSLVIDANGSYQIIWYNRYKKECWTEVSPDTVGQFTGLRDKNGKEIYEGDIICHGDPRIRYVIQWHDTGFRAKQIGSCSYAGIEYWLDVTEVIGNIHEIPDLFNL